MLCRIELGVGKTVVKTVRKMEPWDRSRTVFLPLTRRMLVLSSCQGKERHRLGCLV